MRVTIDPIAVFEIADGVGERRERDGVGADEHLAVAEADGKRRALAGADQQIVLAGEQEGERKCAAQPRQCRLDRIDRRRAALHFLGDEMRDRLRCRSRWRIWRPSPSSSRRSSLKFSMMPLCTTASFSVACGCALFSVGRPCVAQRVWPMPIVPASGSRARRGFEVFQLAFGAPPREHAVFERGDARGIVAAIFEALERIDQLRRSRLAADDSDNAAHPCGCSPSRNRAANR